MTVAVGHLDARTEAYVADVVQAIDAHVPVVEAYLVGSGAAGGFDPRTSDVDLVVVVERSLGEQRRPLIEHVRRIPCPVRELELVVYVEGARPPEFELNLDGGEEAADADAFWFVLDAALAEEHAVPLCNGIPWEQLFGHVPEARIRRSVAESIAWAERRNDEFGRVTAVRGRHYLEHGGWMTKEEASA